MNERVQWYIDLTNEEQGMFMSFSVLLEVDIYKHETPADFLSECGVNICKLLKKTGELQDFAIWMTGCGYDFAALPYFCEQRDKLLK